MSMYSKIGQFWKAYGGAIGVGTSSGMMARVKRTAGLARAAVGPSGGGIKRMAGFAGKSWKNYMWSGASAGQRAARIGTAAGAGVLAGNIVNPKDNWGPF